MRTLHLMIKESWMQTFPNYKGDVEITDLYADMVKQLTERRNTMKVSQEELAYTIGCTTSLIHKWEQHKRVPSGFMLTCWLDALGCTIKICEKNT